MKNKAVTIISIILLFSILLYAWYFGETDVSISSLEAPMELGIDELGTLKINLQNNASKDVNVTINVKNSFVDEKGVSLKVVKILAYENLSYMLSNTTDRSHKEVMLKPGSNYITFMVGYQVPGPQIVEVEVFQKGKLSDSSTVEINVLPSRIAVNLSKNKAVNGTMEIYSVSGDLEIHGKGPAQDVVVNISVIDARTNTTVSEVLRTYSFTAGQRHRPLVVWSNRSSIYDPMTGMMTYTNIETVAPVVVIELSNDPSDNKYEMSPVVVKGMPEDRYEVVVNAKWRDQAVSSSVWIPS